ncbi:hypothetical protein WJX74_004397 [Apatococcus lobatus]|uniref:Dynein intermediate chain n=1 Tax=Apatococcus lobatus TaxID=904363 RepID=A0AAW1R2U1_9CHLO
MPGIVQKAFARKKPQIVKETAVLKPANGATYTPTVPAATLPSSPNPRAKAAVSAEEVPQQVFKEVVRPETQLPLSERELGEEIVKTLTATNPSAPKNVVHFNMRDRVFKLDPMVDQLAQHYSTDGYLLHNTSEEAKRQLEQAKAAEEAAARYQTELERVQQRREEGVGTASVGTDSEPPDDSRTLRNQFNFSDRAAQTAVQPPRDRGTATEPPPTASTTGSCSMWQIYDAYIEDQERQAAAEEQSSRPRVGGRKGGAAGGPNATAVDDATRRGGGTGPMSSAAMGRVARVLERMANQNTFADVSMDFRYWDDAADGVREAEGTLLPLWRFTAEKGRHKALTALCWSSDYLDLFAAGYGSYGFLKQCSGLVACFSLKNPSYPEFSCVTDSGVLCLDLHAQHPNLLAVGCYDGSVHVFDIRQKGVRSLYSATAQTGKHTDPVWQVRWAAAEGQRGLQFFSVSTDGRFTLWTLAKNELIHQNILELHAEPSLAADAADGWEDTSSPGSLAGGCCFDFNQGQDHLFVVGTEEGRIHECSTAHNSGYLHTYLGHHMSVYSVRWNRLHPRFFLSCGADWTVRLWDSRRAQPVLVFDLGSPVGDVAWSPHAATTFAAATEEGKVHVFDISQNSIEALCEQRVVTQGRLTKVAFNPQHPILLVGDDRGCVTCVKLSPNLRRVSQGDAKQTAKELEVAKLEKVIEVALKGMSEAG